MDGIAAKISAKAPRSKKDLKPKAHHFFYAVVWLSGWLTPPLAVLIRFGFGKDFLINIILTLCGYFPGHIHNFYCQTVRNNRNKARTPRWAIKYGLVKVKDPRAGRHQWASRYDERLPDSSRYGYENGEEDDNRSFGEGGSGGGRLAAGEEWDGRGEEPPLKSSSSSSLGGSGSGRSRFGNKSKGSGNGFSFHAPWDVEVLPDEVQGGAKTLEEQDRVDGQAATPYDPFENEAFYDTTPQTEPSRNSHYKPPKLSKIKKKPGGGGGSGSGIFRRDRYESSQGGQGTTRDRFDKMNAAKNGVQDYDTSGGHEYQDEFERELNEGPSSRGGGGAGGGGAISKTTASAPGHAQYDHFEPERTAIPSAASRTSRSRLPAPAPDVDDPWAIKSNGQETSSGNYGRGKDDLDHDF